MMLISELLAGIIIDKFGEMRSDAERIEEDSKSFCFICGQTRDDIEKNYDNDFQYHTKIDHNLWNYMFFIDYLKKPQGSDFAETEKFIKAQLHTGDDQIWFPCYYDYDQENEGPMPATKEHFKKLKAGIDELKELVELALKKDDEEEDDN